VFVQQWILLLLSSDSADNRCSVSVDAAALVEVSQQQQTPGEGLEH